MRRLLVRTLLAVAALAAALAAANLVTPWPAAMAIRLLFDKGAADASRALERHVPTGVEGRRDVRYDPADPDAYLDIQWPKAHTGTAGPAPVVVWIHGGAFIAGHRGDVANYLKFFADAGFATVAIGYSLAPGATYPKPVRQIDAALGFLRREAGALRLDMDRVVLAGDSAGAQLAAQTAAVVTDPAYAAAVGVRPALPASALRGAMLFCGPYDAGAVRTDGVVGFFLQTVLWSYSGRKDHAADPAFARMSVVRHVSAAFPPTFISVGNGDPLAPHSTAMAAALKANGVVVDELCFAADRTPKLGHEYQFNLDDPAGRQALARALDFARRVTGG